MGICNGFQILTETGLLKGALLRNKNLKFINKDINIKVINNDTKFSNKYKKNQILKINIAHNEGNYFTNPDHLKELNKFKLIDPDTRWKVLDPMFSMARFFYTYSHDTAETKNYYIPDTYGGINDKECSKIIINFFKKKRSEIV